ncbi:MAG: hypothetical protein P4M12_02970 [Gammaproteobacteria bacterium]|nr:hypothetical protein [Gammaproteobacteria bacterium]
MSSTSCPECGNTLSAKANRCSCGWLKVRKEVLTTIDYRCAYMHTGRRCPLPGTITPHYRGKALWYCRRHYQALDDLKAGESVLRDAESNHEHFLEEQRDWRRKLFN